jgi:hypothetical protein
MIRHCVNASIFWATFNSLPYLNLVKRRRLLEWKGRYDLLIYASQHAPRLYPLEISQYSSLNTNQEPIDQSKLLKHIVRFEDDGHVAKLIRAVAHGQSFGEKLGNNTEVRNNMWKKMLNIAVDSVDGTGERWVRGAGFDEAWQNFGPRAEMHK